MRRSTTLSEPTQEPLTLDEAKKHLEIAASDDAHDQHIGALIIYARQKYELDTGKLTTSRTVVEKCDEFPTDNYWCLKHGPFISVTHVKYYTATVLTTFTSNDYSLDADRGLIFLDDGATWPTSDVRWDAVQVTYLAGQGTDSSDVPELTKHCLKLLIENAFDDRHKDSTSLLEAYENLIKPQMRSSYP